MYYRIVGVRHKRCLNKEIIEGNIWIEPMDAIKFIIFVIIRFLLHSQTEFVYYNADIDSDHAD